MGENFIYRVKSHIEKNMPNKTIQWPMYKIPRDLNYPKDGSDYVTLELFEGWTKNQLEKHKQSYLKAVNKTKEMRNKDMEIKKSVLIPSDHHYSIDENGDRGLQRIIGQSYNAMNRMIDDAETVREPYRLLSYGVCFKHSAEEFLAEPDFPAKPEEAGIEEDKEYLKS